MHCIRTLAIFLLLLLSSGVMFAQGFDDEFNSLAQSAGWTIIREDRPFWTLNGSEFVINTEPGALNGGVHNDVRNMLVQPSPPSFTMETKLAFSPDSIYHNAGLLYWVDDDNYVRVSRGLWQHDSVKVNGLWLEWEINALTDFQFVDGAHPNPVWLRLTKRGRVFTGAYSADGVTWNAVGQTTIAFATEVAKVGVQAANGQGALATTSTIPARFDWFHIITLGIGDAPEAAATSPRIADVYPDPATHGSSLAVTIDGNSAKGAVLQLSDLLGRVLWTSGDVAEGPASKTISVPTNGLAAGQYLLRLTGAETASARTVRLF